MSRALAPPARSGAKLTRPRGPPNVSTSFSTPSKRNAPDVAGQSGGARRAVQGRRGKAGGSGAAGRGTRGASRGVMEVSPPITAGVHGRTHGAGGRVAPPSSSVEGGQSIWQKQSQPPRSPSFLQLPPPQPHGGASCGSAPRSHAAQTGSHAGNSATERMTRTASGRGTFVQYTPTAREARRFGPGPYSPPRESLSSLRSGGSPPWGAPGSPGGESSPEPPGEPWGAPWDWSIIPIA